MGSTTLTNGGSRYLDSNNKLSSAGAAASLKYARPQDLPSYPSVGLPRNNRQTNDAAAAANLGWTNQKPVKIWKPDPSTSATTAASIGWTRQAPPPWQPQQSASGARAAVLAARSDVKAAAEQQQRVVEPARAKSTSWGNSAATMAMRNDRRSLQAPPTRKTTLDRSGSLLAATGAMARPRQRAESTPPVKTTYPDEANARSNALRAAAHADTAARKRSSRIPPGGAVPVTTMPKEKFTSHPVQPSEDEKAESMHASAIAMAQQMYKTMQKRGEETGEAGYRGDGQHAATAAQGRQRSTSLMSVEPAPMRFDHLQVAAERLAQERLARLHNDEMKSREYRDYYGGSPPPKPHYRDRFRLRASSDTSQGRYRDHSPDVRPQHLYTSNLSKIDNETRQRDRDSLLAMAQRNVAKSLQGIDEQVYAQTGRTAPSMMSGSQMRHLSMPPPQTQQRVEQPHAERQRVEEQRVEQQPIEEEHDERIYIGGGAVVDRNSVDALAHRNVQPVLARIQTKSDAEQARKMEMKLDEEEARRKMEIEKAREKELKEINRQLQELDKKESKARKSEEKAFRRQSKRMSKQSTKSSKTKSTRSGRESVPETTAMSGGAMNGRVSDAEGFRSTEYERIPATEQEPYTAPYAEPAETAEPVQPVQPVAPIQPVPPTRPPRPDEPVESPAPPARPSTVEDENAPEIPVSDFVGVQTPKAQAQPDVLKSTMSPDGPESTVSPDGPESTVSPDVPESTASPSVQKSTAPPTVQKSTASPTVQKSTVSPTVHRSMASPTVHRSMASPTVQRSTASPHISQSSQLGVRTWLRSAFRKTTKGQKEENGGHSPFIGGASLTQPDGPSSAKTNVAAAGKAEAADQEIPVSKYITGGSRYSQDEEQNGPVVSKPSGVTGQSAVDGDHHVESEEARDQFNDADVARPMFKSQRPLSPARDSRFREVI